MSEFKVQRSKVTSACKNALASVKQGREELRVKEIGKYRKRLFGLLPDRTDEQCMRLLMINKYGIPKHTYQGWGTKETAKALLAALKVCGDLYISLDGDDAAFVARWLEN
jgi:hypothetical protein